MERIPLPAEIPQPHYFLEQLNSPEIIFSIRAAFLLLALALAAAYCAVAYGPKGRSADSKSERRDNFMGNELKSGWFGYSKQNVDSYIQRMQEDFARQLQAAEAAKEQEIRELQEQFARLQAAGTAKEQEIRELQEQTARLQAAGTAKEREIRELQERAAQLQQENQTFSRRQAEISSALISAQIYANQLKAEAKAKQLAELAQAQTQYDQVYNQLKGLESEVGQVQTLFSQLLSQMSLDSQRCLDKCGEMRRELEEVQQQLLIDSPDGEAPEQPGTQM